jgi:hypothetical protein
MKFQANDVAAKILAAKPQDTDRVEQLHEKRE